jgi:hypothetical protein
MTDSVIHVCMYVTHYESLSLVSSLAPNGASRPFRPRFYILQFQPFFCDVCVMTPESGLRTPELWKKGFICL